MRTHRNRTKEEIQLFLQGKVQKRIEREERVRLRKENELKKKDFKDNHLTIDQYVTYSNRKLNLNKKSFFRIVELAKVKWGL